MDATRVCSTDGCEKKTKARGWCQSHYSRWYRGSSAEGPLRQYFLDAGESMSARTEVRSGCLVWTGAVGPDGYGHIWAQGTSVPAHRYAWESVNGPVPAGMFIDHTCWNKSCCEVSHLRLATNKQNQENRRGASRNSKSGIRGAVPLPGGAKWQAVVMHNGKSCLAGTFASPEEAGRAAAIKRAELFTHSQN